MFDYEILEVLEYAEDLKNAYAHKDDIEEFNQAVMRLADSVQNIHVIDDFNELKEYKCTQEYIV